MTTTHLTANDIDLGYVPRPVGDLDERELGDEILIVQGQELHVLPPVAADVWRLCRLGDGQPLSTTVEDLAAAYEVAEDVVTGDVLRVVRSFGMLGLFEDIDPGASEVVIGQPASDEVEPGEPLPQLAAETLDGAAVDVRPDHGERLLVWWSARCTHCVRVLPLVIDAVENLAAAGCDVRIVVSGDRDAAVTLLRNAGVGDDAMVFPVGDALDAHAFSGFGTPAAYVVRADGTVAAPFAYGADQITELVEHRTGRAGPEGATTPVRRYLASTETACAPNATPGPMIDWAGTLALEVGQWTIGLRCSTAEGLDRLRTVLADHVIDDPGAPPDFSVVFGEPVRRGDTQVPGLDVFFRTGAQLVRTRNRGRLLHGIVAWLSDLLPIDDPADVVRAHGLLAIGPTGTTTLFPADVRASWKHVGPRLARAGVRVADVPTVLVRADGTVEVPELRLPADLPAPQAGPASKPMPIEPGRHRLDRWAFLHADHAGPVTLGAAVAGIGRDALRPDDVDVDTWLSRLIGTVGAVEPSGLWFRGPAELAGRMLALVDG